MRVGLLLQRSNPEAEAIARDLAAWLRAERHEPVMLDGGAVESLDLLVVLGGDGTLLHGAQRVAERPVPILGINLGTLGFLSTCSPSEARATLAQALAGTLVCERRMRLEVRLVRKSGETLVRYACNDAVVSQGALARLLEFEARLDGALISNYRADGLIVATPTGSTAYSLSAGGPILVPQVEAMVLTPISPHTLTNRPVVVPMASRLQLRLPAAPSNVVLTVDGQWGTEVAEGDLIEVHAAAAPLQLYRPADKPYFDVLREKLGWGGG